MRVTLPIVGSVITRKYKDHTIEYVGPHRYHCSGLSGGNAERPAFKQLMADV